MPCFHPLTAFQEPGAEKAPVFFHRPDGARGFRLRKIQLPCGRCVGCRLERSRQWALRCVHEAQLHEDNSFITLTYNNDHLPDGGTLIKKHFWDFMKRLRRKYAKKISVYYCGEYGEACKQCRLSRIRCRCQAYSPGIGRPHYHALLFGLRFDDQLFHSKSADGSKLYTSSALSLVWGKGFCTVGAVTFESAAYTARYIVKKINGAPAAEHYRVIDATTGEICNVLPEFANMSLKPAIAKDWFGKFKSDVYPDDFVVIRGKKMKPPKYYDKLHELVDPESHLEIKEERDAYARTQKENSTSERLAVRETVALARLKTLKRTVE